MSGAKGRNRIEKRLVDMGAGAAEESALLWQPQLDDPPLVDEYQLDLGPQGYLLIKETLDTSGELAGFAMMQYVRGAAEDHQVCRIDTSHNELHVHYFSCVEAERRVALRPIGNQQVVRHCYEESYAMMLSDWEQNERRWRGDR